MGDFGFWELALTGGCVRVRLRVRASRHMRLRLRARVRMRKRKMVRLKSAWNYRFPRHKGILKRGDIVR